MLLSNLPNSAGVRVENGRNKDVSLFEGYSRDDGNESSEEEEESGREGGHHRCKEYREER